MSDDVLVVSGLRVEFRRRRQSFAAVDGVDFAIGRGTTLGLVGESGSGKSTIGNAILGLVSPSAGCIEFDGRDLTGLSRGDRRRLSSQLQVVFQDPYGSLNPLRTVGQSLVEPLLPDSGLSGSQRRARVVELLERVGLRAADMGRYPAAFSGGQRQRISIARALVSRPRLVVCDEAVSALDLSTQAQILNLLSDLQTELGLSMLFISHDLAVVRYVSTDIVVLRGGRVVEKGAADDIYLAPRNEYTRALLAASPTPDPARKAELTRLAAAGEAVLSQADARRTTRTRSA
ncbi:MAG: ATP-binding cassette domain-containing protein [Bifidobacteriaceae bacterium]|nr:ATP-binding cassette domain-containing protein [Bifidobacteriaceae bacterium]